VHEELVILTTELVGRFERSAVIVTNRPIEFGPEASQIVIGEGSRPSVCSRVNRDGTLCTVSCSEEKKLFHKHDANSTE